MSEKNKNSKEEKINQKTDNINVNNANAENVDNSNYTQKQTRKKKNRIRMYIVLAFILLVAIVGYVIYRGEYLEILELGEEYISIFWQNVNYSAIAFIINFVILFLIIYANNNRIKKALKPFFESEKKVMPKLPNKSISFIISIIVSAITTELILNQYMLFTNSTMFVKSDPIFGLDIGYFIFQKPFIETILLYAICIIVGLTIYTIIHFSVVLTHFTW